MLLAFILSILAAIFCAIAKKKRDTTGAVRNPQTAMALVAVIAALIAWIKALIGG